MKNEKITSQKEADEIQEYLIRLTIKRVGCSREQAAKRMVALFASGEIDNIEPNMPGLPFERIVDRYMTTEAK